MSNVRCPSRRLVRLGRKFSNVQCKAEGFTLIELVVLMAVIVIISSIVFLNLRENEGSLALQRAADVVTQNISQAKINSLGNKNHGGTTSAGGFGIYLEQNRNKIVIFADCDGDGNFGTVDDASNCNVATESTPYNELFSTVLLSGQIVVSTLIPCSGTPCALTMTFVPPDPTTVFIPGFVGAEAQIGLRDDKGNTVDIFINRLGVTRISQ